MPDITNYDGRLEQMAYYCEQMLDNIAKVNNAYHDEVENAYVAVLPEKLIKWKGVTQVGGHTVVWNQLVDTGTTEVATISGRKYYTLINGTASIVTSDGTAISVVDDTADMVVDLTLCFGKGNEPATTSAFTDVFPAEHYEYNAGTLLSAGATEIISKDSDDNVLQTYAIPAELQALEGYGWSAGSVSNYIDFKRKKFVKCVGSIDLGTLNYDYIGGKFISKTGVPGIKLVLDSTAKPNVLCKGYVASRYYTEIYAASVDKIIGLQNNDYGKVAAIDKSYDSAATFKTAVNGTILFYELAEPVETDISELLTDETITEVEAGGSIAVPNNQGDDYKIPVPVGLEYIGVV